MQKPAPIAGYRPVSEAMRQLVNINKHMEETALRQLDTLATITVVDGEDVEIDKRWLAIGRTHMEQAWMAINRAVMRPGRVILTGEPGNLPPPRDSPPPPGAMGA